MPRMLGGLCRGARSLHSLRPARTSSSMRTTAGELLSPVDHPVAAGKDLLERGDRPVGGVGYRFQQEVEAHSVVGYGLFLPDFVRPGLKP